MAILLKADGSRVEVKPAKGRFTLEELQKLVGGYIEPIRLPDGRIMLLHEEAKMQTPWPPENLAANALAMGLIALDDTIVGDVLVVDDTEFD